MHYVWIMQDENLTVQAVFDSKDAIWQRLKGAATLQYFDVLTESANVITGKIRTKTGIETYIRISRHLVKGKQHEKES